MPEKLFGHHLGEMGDVGLVHQAPVPSRRLWVSIRKSSFFGRNISIRVEALLLRVLMDKFAELLLRLLVHLECFLSKSAFLGIHHLYHVGKMSNPPFLERHSQVLLAQFAGKNLHLFALSH